MFYKIVFILLASLVNAFANAVVDYKSNTRVQLLTTVENENFLKGFVWDAIKAGDQKRIRWTIFLNSGEEIEGGSSDWPACLLLMKILEAFEVRVAIHFSEVKGSVFLERVHISNSKGRTTQYVFDSVEKKMSEQSFPFHMLVEGALESVYHYANYYSLEDQQHLITEMDRLLHEGASEVEIREIDGYFYVYEIKLHSEQELQNQLHIKLGRNKVEVYSQQQKEEPRKNPLIKKEECIKDEKQVVRRGAFEQTIMQRFRDDGLKDNLRVFCKEAKDFNEQAIGYRINNNMLSPFERMTNGWTDDLPEPIQTARLNLFQVLTAKAKKGGEEGVSRKIEISRCDFNDPLMYDYIHYLLSTSWSGASLKDNALRDKFIIIMKAWRLFYMDHGYEKFPFDFNLAGWVGQEGVLPDIAEELGSYSCTDLARWEERFRGLSASISKKLELLTLHCYKGNELQNERQEANTVHSRTKGMAGKDSLESDCFKKNPSLHFLKAAIVDMRKYLLWGWEGKALGLQREQWVKGPTEEICQKKKKPTKKKKEPTIVDPVLAACDTESVFRLALAEDSPIDRDWQVAAVMLIEKMLLDLNIQLIDDNGVSISFPAFITGLGNCAKRHFKSKNEILSVDSDPVNPLTEPKEETVRAVSEQVGDMENTAAANGSKSELEHLELEREKLSDQLVGMKEEIDKLDPLITAKKLTLESQKVASKTLEKEINSRTERKNELEREIVAAEEMLLSQKQKAEKAGKEADDDLARKKKEIDDYAVRARQAADDQKIASDKLGEIQAGLVTSQETFNQLKNHINEARRELTNLQSQVEKQTAQWVVDNSWVPSGGGSSVRIGSSVFNACQYRADNQTQVINQQNIFMLQDNNAYQTQEGLGGMSNMAASSRQPGILHQHQSNYRTQFLPGDNVSEQRGSQTGRLSYYSAAQQQQQAAMATVGTANNTVSAQWHMTRQGGCNPDGLIQTTAIPSGYSMGGSWGSHPEKVYHSRELPQTNNLSYLSNGAQVGSSVISTAETTDSQQYWMQTDMKYWSQSSPSKPPSISTLGNNASSTGSEQVYQDREKYPFHYP